MIYIHGIVAIMILSIFLYIDTKNENPNKFQMFIAVVETVVLLFIVVSLMFYAIASFGMDYFAWICRI
jgi:hypothetical protein